MGFAKGKARFPFALFWFLLQGQKKRLGGEPYKLSHAKGFATPLGDMGLSYNFCRQPLLLISFATSPYTG